uniref:Catalase n=1 Tax=Heterorhabditis bacteriophora TaxID=37862 RepID=A0A1I7WTV8_HETBA
MFFHATRLSNVGNPLDFADKATLVRSTITQRTEDDLPQSVTYM